MLDCEYKTAVLVGLVQNLQSFYISSVLCLDLTFTVSSHCSCVLYLQSLMFLGQVPADLVGSFLCLLLSPELESELDDQHFGSWESHGFAARFDPPFCQLKS